MMNTQEKTSTVSDIMSDIMHMNTISESYSNNIHIIEANPLYSMHKNYNKNYNRNYNIIEDNQEEDYIVIEQIVNGEVVHWEIPMES